MIEYPGKYWKDYELLDSGAGEKLERFGGYVLARPEPKALWDKSLPESEWKRRAHTEFVPGAGFGRAGKEDSGTWRQLRKMDEQWYLDYRSPQGLEMKLRLGMTSFKHVGVFPEQAPTGNTSTRRPGSSPQEDARPGCSTSSPTPARPRWPQGRLALMSPISTR